MPASPPQTDAPVLERTFEVRGEGRCRLRVPRATVTLEAGASGEAHVAIDAADGTLPDAARAFAEMLRVRYDEGVLRIEPARTTALDGPAWRVFRDGAPVVNVRVRVPATFGADVHAPAGTVTARRLSGPVTLEATGGTVHAADLGGRLDVLARRCKTTIEGFTGKKATLHIQGGRLDARSLRAETLSIESNAAELRLKDLDAALRLLARDSRLTVAALRGPLDGELQGGTCQFAPEAGHTVRVRAPGSDVRLQLAESHAADVRLAAHRLRLGPLAARLDGEQTPRRAEGMLGGGGASLDVSVPGGALRCK